MEGSFVNRSELIEFVRARGLTFSVPNHFAKHMMIVADLAAADTDAIEEALVAAWELQRVAE